MQGSSRQVLHGLSEKLEALVDSGSDAATLSRELFAIGDLLASQSQLRRTLTNETRDDADRAGLIKKVLAGQVSDTTLDVAGDVVSGNWNTSNDLIDAFEALGQHAALAAAEASGNLDAVEDEVFRFARIVEKESELALTLSNSTLDKAQKVGIIEKLLEGQAKPETISLVIRAVTAPRALPLLRSLEQLTEAAAERHNSRVATVTSATALSAAQVERLAAVLSRQYDAHVQVQVQVDPSLVGGLVVSLAGEVIDGSVIRKLDTAARAVAK